MKHEIPRAGAEAAPKKKWYASSTFWIFFGLLLGVVLGGFLPKDQHPIAFEFFHFLSKSFISLIKGIIVPILISTIIVGIAQTGDLRSVGRMGFFSLVYFELVTTVALFIGLGIANVLRPGDGLPLATTAHVELARPQTVWDTLGHLFPSNLVRHAAEGDVLPVVIFSMLFGIALTKTGERGKPVLAFFEAVSQVMFKYTGMIMWLTPVGVFGAMAYNVSQMAGGNGELRGWPAVFDLLRHYSLVVFCLYFSLILLFLIVFVPVLLMVRVPIGRFLRHVREPAITAFSTASSEAALPKLLEEMERFGVPRRVASFVIPTGYSFNLDGSTLYLVLASMTIAQAAKIEMSFGSQLFMVFTFMLTSKGVAGVPRATLVIIAATCQGFGLPGEAGVAMLLAVDEVMDMARSACNVMGNGLASVVIARAEGVLDLDGAAAPIAAEVPSASATRAEP